MYILHAQVCNLYMFKSRQGENRFPIEAVSAIWFLNFQVFSFFQVKS